MTIPKLISNRHGRNQPMTRQQSWFFGDNGMDNETEADREIERGLCEEHDNVEGGLRSDDDVEDIPF